jgi:hypothetical protein
MPLGLDELHAASGVPVTSVHRTIQPNPVVFVQSDFQFYFSMPLQRPDAQKTNNGGSSPANANM